ncbi:MAG: hypothetical protein H6737_20370 [Alphaproteobacteria bacterium]|nr:hypothetical protein [Alphaproteobacteria bacterium]
MLAFLVLLCSVGRAAPETSRIDDAMAHLEAADAASDEAMIEHLCVAAALVARGQKAGEPGAAELADDLRTALVLLIALHAIDPDLDDLRDGARLADGFVALDPDDPLGWSVKGWFLREAGELGSARKAWRKAITRIEDPASPPDPEYVDTFVGLAEITPRGARGILESGLEIVARDRARSDDAREAQGYDEAEAELRRRLGWAE